MDTISKTDIVKLKSCGPEMEVKGVDSDNDAFCFWRNSRNYEMFGSFPIFAITKL